MSVNDKLILANKLRTAEVIRALEFEAKLIKAEKAIAMLKEANAGLVRQVEQLMELLPEGGSRKQ